MSSFGTYFEVLGRRFFIFSVLLSERRVHAMIAVPMQLLAFLLWDCSAIVVVLLCPYFLPLQLFVSSCTVWMSPDQPRMMLLLGMSVRMEKNLVLAIDAASR